MYARTYILNTNKRQTMRHHITNIALCGLLAAGVGTGLTSCDDFLTITPSSSIVEEDFWQDRNDLNSAVFACYKRMVDNDMLSKYIYWGEVRSDNFERSSTIGATSETAQIMNANLLETYRGFAWTPMYNAINYCNKVLAHGPEVVANDESFSEGEWTPIRAEIITLRALCHFYLVRTFGEIPYITVDYNNDSQELKAPQSTQLEVLDNIIADLEEVKDLAMVDYGNTVDNKGRITRKAVYALLADVYLWRASYKAGGNQPFSKISVRSSYAGPTSVEDLVNRQETYTTDANADYDMCIEYCDRIIDMAKQEKIDYANKNGLNPGGQEIEVENSDLLENNDPNNNSIFARSYEAYYSIFGMGNSDEAIFELQVDGITYSNSMITDYFWNIKDSKVGSLTGAKPLFENIEQSPNSANPASLYTKTDMRRWETLQFEKVGQTDFNIGKYINRMVTQKVGTTSLYLTDNSSTAIKVTSTMRSNSNRDANFIVYRMSEIFLMKAEALVQRYKDEAENDKKMEEAFSYVREVFKRSNPYAYSPNNTNAKDDSLKMALFTTTDELEGLILTERQREFVGEGKRWYDLVRYALRHGGTSEMLAFLTRKYSTSDAIKAKLADIQSLYSPIFKDELINNNWLYQNGVWESNETSSRNDGQ